MSVPKCLFFQDLEGLTEVFGGMSAGMSGRKLPLWAEFSFLNAEGASEVRRGASACSRFSVVSASLGVVLPHLLGEIFRAIFSQA